MNSGKLPPCGMDVSVAHLTSWGMDVSVEAKNGITGNSHVSRDTICSMYNVAVVHEVAGARVRCSMCIT